MKSWFWLVGIIVFWIGVILLCAFTLTPAPPPIYHPTSQCQTRGQQ